VLPLNDTGNHGPFLITERVRIKRLHVVCQTVLDDICQRSEYLRTVLKVLHGPRHASGQALFTLLLVPPLTIALVHRAVLGKPCLPLSLLLGTG